MNTLTLLLILSILILLIYVLIKSYKNGLALAMFFLVFVADTIMFELPGDFPNLSIHRLILILLIIIWSIKNRSEMKMRDLPFINLFLILGIINLISVFTSDDIIFSIKVYLSFTVEVILFYIVLASSLNSEIEQIKCLNAMWLGLFFVAIFASIEKYTTFNPIDSLLAVNNIEGIQYAVSDVRSTYPHRILLGTAMSMGWPIAVSLTSYYQNKFLKKIVILTSILLLISSCYFAQSRGPWLASFIAGIVLFSLGSSNIKKKLIYIVMLVLLVLMLKPGVWETIFSRAEDTMNVQSFKGSTYEYRWELWKRAYSEISKSPYRLLFGFGPGASDTMNLEAVLSYSGRYDDFWSWDNHYAANLLETGVIGLFIIIILYIYILKKLYEKLKNKSQPYRDLLAGIIASVVVFIFMKTNVSIFAVQLDYLFLGLIVVGIRFSESSFSLDE